MRKLVLALGLATALAGFLAADQAVNGSALLAQHDGGQAAAQLEPAAPGGEAHGADELGTKLPLWSVIPFVGILLSIALFPLLAPGFWHHHFPKVSAFWALLFAVPFLLVFKGAAFYEIMHIFLVDYIPFIILLWGLFTAAGGLLVRGSIVGTPLVNTVFLAIGTVAASWIGTTGAAMVMIRPVIRSNKNRRFKVHTIVFFIFLVANIGGSLTPLGDPPLFLGFLHGVPFFWTLNLLPVMFLLSATLLGLYFLVDTVMYGRERKQPSTEAPAAMPAAREPLRLVGLQNLLFLLGIVGAVLMSGTVELGEVNVLGVHLGVQNLLRDALIIGMGLLSLKFTSKAIRKENEFSWFPIKEVAYLFAGIFMAIIPALLILRAGTSGALAFLINAVDIPRTTSGRPAACRASWTMRRPT